MYFVDKLSNRVSIAIRDVSKDQIFTSETIARFFK